MNPRVRRAVLWWYIGPLVAFFSIIALLVLYVMSHPQEARTNDDVERAVGTAGHTTPGGHNPDRTPSSTEKELEERGAK